MGTPISDDYFIGKKMTEYDKPFYFGVPISRQPMSNPGLPLKKKSTSAEFYVTFHHVCPVFCKISSKKGIDPT